MPVRSARLADCPLQWTNRNQVPIVDVPHIVRAQRDESLSAARRGDEFNLEMVCVMDLHDCAQVAGAKAGVRQITFQYNGVEKLEHKITSETP